MPHGGREPARAGRAARRRRGRVPAQGRGARRHRRGDPRGRGAAAWSSPPRTRRSSSTRRRTSPRRPSASRTGGSSRSTSASATRASATASSSTPDDFYERLATAPELPTTSQPTPGDFLAVYEELARLRADPLAAHLRRRSPARSAARAPPPGSSAASACASIDTARASAAIAMLALAIQRRLERGTTDEEIDALVERYRARHGLLFTVDTLEFLARGGRIGRARALAGELLNVKPILAIATARCVPLKRVRGSQKAFAEFARRSRRGRPTGRRCGSAIAHADAPERARGAARAGRATSGRRRRSRSSRRSAPSSARTPARAPSGSSGSTTLSSGRGLTLLGQAGGADPSRRASPAWSPGDWPRRARRRGPSGSTRSRRDAAAASARRCAKRLAGSASHGRRPPLAPAAPLRARRRRGADRRPARPRRRWRSRATSSARRAPAARAAWTLVKARVARRRAARSRPSWFNQPWLAERLRPGTHVRLRGQLERGQLPGHARTTSATAPATADSRRSTRRARRSRRSGCGARRAGARRAARALPTRCRPARAGRALPLAGGRARGAPRPARRGARPSARGAGSPSTSCSCSRSGSPAARRAREDAVAPALGRARRADRALPRRSCPSS